MKRRITGAACAALTAVAVAIPAQAAAAERLEGYLIETRRGADIETLSLAGYDVREGGRRGGIEVATTRTGARELRRQGLKVTLLRDRRGRTTTQAVASQAVGGWNVWRPYGRTDITDQTTGKPAVNIKTQLERMAADNPSTTKLVTIGTSVLGQPIYAMKVTKNARSSPDGDKPAVLYSAVQHAREWLAGETNLRTLKMFVDNYGKTGTAKGTDGQPVDGVDAAELTRLVDKTELWFVPIANPDGYDYSFTPANRLWRKNMRDNDGDGVREGFADGVDLNRNFPTRWGFDEEGSSGSPWDETYRGPGPASEPETKALDALVAKIKPAWNKNDHTHGRLLLYPFGWQVDTHAADEPIFKAITGIDDDHPAIPTFDPDLGAELYTTNGDTNDHLYKQHKTISFTPEGTPGNLPGQTGFVFQDVEADVQAEFERHAQFSLDLARSARDPSRPSSHLGNTVPDFEVDSFDVSYGDPQTVQVNARRDLGPVQVRSQINGGAVRVAETIEWAGGERYGDEGDNWYHRMRAQVAGAKPGDKVKVWFHAPRTKSTSQSFTYTLKSDSGRPVLVLANEDYTGIAHLPSKAPRTAPEYLAAHQEALAANGLASDAYDIDAMDRKAPHPLGVLSHYKAVVWYTGDDVWTQAQGTTQSGANPGTTTQPRADRAVHVTQMAVRDYLNEGGKVLYDGKYAGRQYTTSSYPEPSNASGQCDGNVGSTSDRCLPLSNDVLQYYFGAYTRYAGFGLDAPAGILGLTGIAGSFADGAFGLNGADSAGNQEVRTGGQQSTSAFQATSAYLPKDRHPQFGDSSVLADWDYGGVPWDTHSGTGYAFSGYHFLAHKRMARTVDLTGEESGQLKFWASRNGTGNRPVFIVEARTAGQDDWTTLPDAGGKTSQATGPCPESFSGREWLDYHPHLKHYLTYSPDPDGTGPLTASCAPKGTTGEWHAVTGTSPGWQEFTIDLSGFKGKQVEVAISVVTDWQGLSSFGQYVDDVTVTRGDEAPESEGFESGLGAWKAATVEDSIPTAGSWTQQRRTIGAVIGTQDTLYLGFGIEGVNGAEGRKDLVGRAMQHLLGGSA